MRRTISAPVLSIFGGKITTFRKLAEHALEDLKRFFPAMKPAWTETAKLPGGDMPDADFDRFLATVKTRFPFLDAALAYRLSRAYGTRIADLLGTAASMADLGEDFGARAHGSRGRLSRSARMGAQRRRHPVAALEAWASRPGG